MGSDLHDGVGMGSEISNSCGAGWGWGQTFLHGVVMGSNIRPRVTLYCASLNVRYATHKMAHIHDIIDQHSLDILCLSETNIAHDAPTAIKDDLAPRGFATLHAPRVGRKKVTRRWSCSHSSFRTDSRTY